jgi:hypothetical protein
MPAPGPSSYRAVLERAGVDADQVAVNLYQGSSPPPGDVLKRLGFNALVLTAEECFPAQEAKNYPGVDVIYCPLLDQSDMTAFRPGDWERVKATGQALATRLARGQKVLICCHAGHNRSGLLTAYVLH